MAPPLQRPPEPAPQSGSSAISPILEARDDRLDEMAMTLATIVANQHHLMQNQDLLMKNHDHLMKKVEDIESILERLSIDFKHYENFATQVSDRLIQLTSFISRKTSCSRSGSVGSRQGSQDEEGTPSTGEGAEGAQSHTSETFDVIDPATVATAVHEAEAARGIAQGLQSDKS